MAEYIIHAHNYTTNETILCKINDTSTIENLFNDVLKISSDIYDISCNDEDLNELDKDTILVDIGLGHESVITINSIYTPDELKIIDEYSLDALEAYVNLFHFNSSEIEYYKFDNEYRGYFRKNSEFVDYF